MRPPHASPTTRARIATALAVTGALTAATLVTASVSAVDQAAGATSRSASVVTTVTLPATGPVKVYWRGNGHGHGMSQYGARGAALQGLNTKQILAFYFPGTTLATLAPSTLRVRLTNSATTYLTVLAGTPGLKLSGYGTLPATGWAQFRLTPSGSGLALQGRRTATGAFTSIRTGLPSRADFSTSTGWVQTLQSDGTSIRYDGTVGSVRSGSSALIVNRVPLDSYVAGSVPYEMPTSWPAAAVQAQAVAARSYAERVRQAAGSSSLYDICDTTDCQMYRGAAIYSSTGRLLATDDPDALAGNANTVLRYKGQPVLAQYAASNGGATVDGGVPYLVGRTDPYDTAASGDPYLDENDTVTANSLASSYGLRSVSSVEVTQRDGNGPWGGRILKAYVNGVTRSGATAHVATDGFTLGDAVGAYTDYLAIGAPPGTGTPTAPRSVSARAFDAGAIVSWAAPATAPGAVTAYQLVYGLHTVTVAATARSSWVGPLTNLGTTRVYVRAVSASGLTPAATVDVTPKSSPSSLVALTPARVLDTRPGAPVTAAHPYSVIVPGRAGIPRTGVRSVQLSVTVARPSASGVLTVTTAGVNALPLASIAYQAGRTTTSTVSVPVVSSSMFVFRPSAGSVALIADAQSYTASAGSRIATAPRQLVASLGSVATGGGTAFSLARGTGVTAATTAVVLGIDATSTTPTWLRVWADGARVPSVQQVQTGPNAPGTATVVVPLPASRTLRIAAGAAGATARVTLLGTVGTTGGRLESVPPSPLADDASPWAGRTVGTTPVSLSMLGVAQVPKAGASAVLVQLTVRAPGRAGVLWAYPGTVTAVPATPSVRFSATGSTTSTELVQVTAGGVLRLRSSVAGARVSVDVIGYVTTG